MRRDTAITLCSNAIAVGVACLQCVLGNQSSHPPTPKLTCCNANVAGCIDSVWSDNRNVSRKNAKIAGCIRYVDCDIDDLGHRISDVSEFTANVESELANGWGSSANRNLSHSKRIKTGTFA